jgi:hypothetical protein
MIPHSTLVFIIATFAFWFIGMWRLAYRPKSRALSSFFLGMCVMSFFAIWISGMK